MLSSGSGMMIAEGKKAGKGWPELQGENSWKGLLNPLDLDLRKSIISYGELAQAAGEAFNAEEHSPHLGACLYLPSHLLSGTGVAAAGYYKVTKLLYATSGPSFLVGNDVESNFMGYVAVATDEGVAALGRRDIVVAWRGTVRPLEWANDASFLQVPAKLLLGPASETLYPNAKVHGGFLSLYTSSNTNSNKTSARDQVHEEVKRLVEQYKDEETSITITGHSLGGALSILTAVDIVANSVNAPARDDSSARPPCPVTAIVFACPQVGNPEFKIAFDSFEGLNALHMQNQGDVVPQLLLWFGFLGIKYVGVGMTMDIHTDKSPYLRKIPEISTLQSCETLDDLSNYLKRNVERLGILHDLECYLHGVAGEQGGDAPFELAVDRDVPLVNKSTNALKEDQHVPANWWVAQNKHMVKDADGHWKLKDFDL